MVNIETLPHCPSLYVFEILFSDGEYFKIDVNWLNDDKDQNLKSFPINANVQDFV